MPEPYASPPIKLSIRALAEFLYRRGSIDSRFSGLNRAQQGSRLHRKLQKQAGPGYLAEVPLSIELFDPPFAYELSGRADGVLPTSDGSLMVDEIKSTGMDPSVLTEDHNPAHWAQARLYAHILCTQQALVGCTVQLTYINVDTEDIRRFQRQYSAAELQAFVDELLAAYRPWAQLSADWKRQRDGSLQDLAFPFPSYREGQRTLAVAAYTSFRDREILFACAPTGIGKTLSTLFPALKALGEGHGQRVFYLTAKTSTRAAAQDAVALLRSRSPSLAVKNLTLTAKDKVCFLEELACFPERCPYADGYYDRLNAALFDLLQSSQTFTRPAVEAAAREYALCPYELSLDLSLFCDVIICDYNYLFDPIVHLQRFFEGGNADENIFLIDEAHNLVDRGREMHSARLSKSAFFDFKKTLPKAHSRLHRALTALNSAFVSLRKQCEQAEAPAPVQDAADGAHSSPSAASHCASSASAFQSNPRRSNTLSQREYPEGLDAPLQRFTAAAEAFLEQHRGHDLENDLLTLYFDALFFQRITENYSEAYQTLITRYGRDVVVKLFCLDASPFLAESLSKGRGSVLFSATLRPLPYYRDTLGGGENALLLELPSPFPQGNLGLFVADRVNTRYARRQSSLASVVDLLSAMAASRPGRYIAYFPSYAYMQDVHALFAQRHPDQPTLLQSPGMTEEERDAFLLHFAPGSPAMDASPALLAFCVMGGVFGEGIDLPGDALIGTAVVGVGLPQLGPEPDALRAYYDDLAAAPKDASNGVSEANTAEPSHDAQQSGSGFDYAYQYPGMNKVMQAAGRVIRTPEDKGVVLLIDDRFTRRDYQRLFPRHWSHWQRISPADAQEMLERFWHDN